jgi:HD superfamily phosphohydrolase
MQIKSISKHRPKDMIIDIPEEDAKAILKHGNFVELTKENLIVKKKKLSEQEIWDLNKNEQEEIINSFGEENIPRYEEGRVKKIIELQNL